ncbi:hypothetical protein C2857_002217 [Epichloe festucae Fl1]|uniref:Uncharacterized protein n=1 Tax=Epichloe festucae (strain Fl1) TaxID=877507 RepID=A0A7U3Q1M2_EPIFF|nr:hypothetical protein C2857_002217 [Epichloe festucae Fl1]
MMDRDQSFLLHIVVHRGSFHDASHERRVGLWFFPSDQGPQYYFQAQGAFCQYKLDVKEDWDPTCTGSVLPLAYTTKTRPICTKKLVQLLQRVPIRNDDNEFNGQQWVWSALECLTRNGYLTKHQQDDGLSQMLEAILNGSSDEVQQAGHRRND